MKTKTARRFLSRNAYKAAHIKTFTPNKKNHFTRRWQECLKTVTKEMRIKNEQKEKAETIET